MSIDMPGSYKFVNLLNMYDKFYIDFANDITFFSVDQYRIYNAVCCSTVLQKRYVLNDFERE